MRSVCAKGSVTFVDMCGLIFTPHTPLPSPPCGAGSCCATFMQMNCMSHPRNSCMWQHEDESKQLEETVCPSRMILIVRAVKTSYFNIFSTSVMLFDFHLGSIGGGRLTEETVVTCSPGNGTHHKSLSVIVYTIKRSPMETSSCGFDTNFKPSPAIPLTLFSSWSKNMKYWRTP